MSVPLYVKEDARWLYTWDGENRLTAMEEKPIANASPGQTLNKEP